MIGRARRCAAPVLLVAIALTSCSDDDGAAADAVGSTVADASQEVTGTSIVGASSTDQFPTVEQVATTYNADGTFDFEVTMTSPYDSPERYADGWRVVGPDGTEYGTHTLAHDHANEQPFTRRQSGVAIPDDVTEVVVEGRDLANGFGGKTQSVTLVREVGS